MTMTAAKLLETNLPTRLGWGAELDSSSATALEPYGAIRWDFSPYFGFRRFQYLRCDQSGGCTVGQLQSVTANESIASISGTHSTTTIETTGLTADIHVGGILYCLDDAGGSGAAPEGESGVITANSATIVTIGDAFSVAPVDTDAFTIIFPWAVVDSADGDFASEVAGVAMAAHDQYDWGWFQFEGINPLVDAVAAGTTFPTGESVVAGTACVDDGAGDAADLRIGVIQHGLTTDTVVRKAIVDLFCGSALKLNQSTA